MKQHFFLSKIPFFLTLSLLSFLLISCGGQKEPLARTGFYFDTVITVTLYDKQSEKLLDECFSLAETYENRLSKTRENSDVWNINHGNGQPVSVSEDTLTLLRCALSYAVLSDGKTDPTIGTVTELWDFSASSAAIIPSQEDLDEALSHVGYRNITISGDTVSLFDPQTEIDLGFIAKGFIGDRMKEFLIANGVSSAIINLGGNVVLIGEKPDGSPFKIGIQKPFAPIGSSALTLELSDISVVSSGNYERYFIKDDTLYHHILSTRTGYPATSGLSQVTILYEHIKVISKICLKERRSIQPIRTLALTLPTVETLFDLHHFILSFLRQLALGRRSSKQQRHPCAVVDLYPCRTGHTITAAPAEIPGKLFFVFFDQGFGLPGHGRRILYI